MNKFITYIIIISFLYSNCVYAVPVSTLKNTLAPQGFDAAGDGPVISDIAWNKENGLLNLQQIQDIVRSYFMRILTNAGVSTEGLDNKSPGELFSCIPKRYIDTHGGRVLNSYLEGLMDFAEEKIASHRLKVDLINSSLTGEPTIPDINRKDPTVSRIPEEIDFLINQDNWGGAATQLQRMHDRDLVIRLLIEEIAKLGMEQRAGVLTLLERDAPQIATQLYASGIETISVSELRNRINTAVSRLKTGNPGVRELARRALVEIGEPSVKPLTGVLCDKDPEVRELARKALVEIGEPSVGPLIGVLHDKDPGVRELARRALVEIGEPSVKPLTGVLRDKDPGVRELARKALVEIGEPSVKPLTAVLNVRCCY